MKNITLKTSLILVASLCFSPTSFADTNTDSVKPFPNSSLKGWKEKSFKGNTSYELVEKDGATVLKASSDKAASVLYKRQSIDISSTPWIEWSWNVESIYKDIEEKTKSGDDYPARLYVTHQVGLLPWDTIAINYVWSSKQPTGTAWPSPYTEKAMMVSVQSGESMTGEWISQRRNIVEDFKTFFNVDVDEISGYAVMVDSDNALQSGTAYFGNIDFLAN